MAPTKIIILVLLAVYSCYGGQEEDVFEKIIDFMRTDFQLIDFTLRIHSSASAKIVNMSLKNSKLDIQLVTIGIELKIDQLIKKSEKAGENITKCIADNDEQIDKLIEDAYDGYSKCNEDQLERINNITDVVNDSLPDMSETENKMREIFKKCRDNDAPCKSVAIDYAKNLTKEVRLEAEAILNESKIDYAKVREDLLCYAIVNNTSIGQANEFFESVTTCILSILLDPSTTEHSLPTTQNPSTTSIPNNSLNNYYFINNSLIILSILCVNFRYY